MCVYVGVCNSRTHTHYKHTVCTHRHTKKCSVWRRVCVSNKMMSEVFNSWKSVFIQSVCVFGASFQLSSPQSSYHWYTNKWLGVFSLLVIVTPVSQKQEGRGYQREFWVFSALILIDSSITDESNGYIFFLNLSFFHLQFELLTGWKLRVLFLFLLSRNRLTGTKEFLRSGSLKDTYSC